MSRQRVRLRISKGIKYISHLDLARCLERALRRAEIPIVFSGGFNPRPKLQFAAPLALGITSQAELIELELSQPLDPQHLKERLNSQLPSGLEVLAAWEAVSDKEPKIEQVNTAEYEIEGHLSRALSLEEIEKSLNEFLAKGEIRVQRQSPKGVKEVNLRPFIYHLRVWDLKENWISLRLRVQVKARVSELLAELDNRLGGLKPLRVHRIKMESSADSI